LLLGRLLRARAPLPEKLATYECGEPAIGSSFVQFDLRFYVVALVFLVFEVEVAFFFPWAVVFGEAARATVPASAEVVATGGSVEATSGAGQVPQGFGERHPPGPNIAASLRQQEQAIVHAGRRLALASMIDVGVFFAVLLVGFAYVWRRGDLDWVRATQRQPLAGAEESGDRLGLGNNPLARPNPTG